MYREGWTINSSGSKEYVVGGGRGKQGTLPEEGVGRRSVRGRWTTRTETKVHKEERERVGGGGRKEVAREGISHSLSVTDGLGSHGQEVAR